MAHPSPGSSEERELLLSMYLDGELPQEQRADIEAKLESDPDWQATHRAFTNSEKKLTRAASDGWHDEEFTGKVRDNVKRLPPPNRAELAALDPAVQKAASEGAPEPANTKTAGRARAARSSEPEGGSGLVVKNPLRLAMHLAFMTVALGLFVWKFLLSGAASTANPTAPMDHPTDATAPAASKVIAHLICGKIRTEPADPVDLALKSGQTVFAKEEAALRLEEGGAILLSRGAELRLESPGSLELRAGQALVLHAPQESSEIPLLKVSVAHNGFSVEVTKGAAELALDASGDFTVRAVEGAQGVRGASKLTIVPADQIYESHEETVSADDPRIAAAHWDALLNEASAKVPALKWPALEPLWSQASGAAGHTGLAPFAASFSNTLTGQPLIAWPVGKESTWTPSGPAVAASSREIFVMLTDGKTSQLFGCSSASTTGHPDWQALDEPLNGKSACAPVLTRDLALSVSGTTVRGWNRRTQKRAFQNVLDAEILSLSFAPGQPGLILCGTEKSLIALDLDGKEKWRCKELPGVNVPVSAHGGTLVALANNGNALALDFEGKPRAEGLRIDPYGDLRPPVQVLFKGKPGFRVYTATGNEGSFDAEGHPGNVVSLRSQAAGRWYLGNMLFAAGNKITFPADYSEFTLPVAGDVFALASDGQSVYAVQRHVVTRLRLDAQTKLPVQAAPDTERIAKGDIILGGLTLLPGKILVTTTEGLQFFE